MSKIYVTPHEQMYVDDYILFLKERERFHRDHGNYDKAQNIMWRIQELLNPERCGKCGNEL